MIREDQQKEKEAMSTEDKEQKERIEKINAQIEEKKAKIKEIGADDVFVSNCLNLQCVVGEDRSSLAEHITLKAASAIDSRSNDVKSALVALESLDEQKPKDAVEARLISQAAALYSSGMDCLSRANRTDTPDFMNVYGNLAAKYLRLHNETIEALGRYRRGGEQKVTVVHLADKMAVVNNYGGGAYHKNEGGSPCNTRNAAPSVEEPAQVSHVETMQLPGQEDVGCTAEKVPAQRQKKAVNA